MLTQSLKIGDSLIEYTTANERVDKFNESLIIRKLSSIYGDVSVATSSIQEIATAQEADQTVKMENLITARLALDPAFEAAFVIYNDVSTFAKLAARILKFYADGWHSDRWINARNSTAKQIDEAFVHYLTYADLWNSIKAAMASTDRPNGAEGSPADQLTKAELDNPLPEQAAENSASA